MNPIISSELTLFTQELQRLLSPKVLQEIAKQVGFVQQSSNYRGLCSNGTNHIFESNIPSCYHLKIPFATSSSSEILTR